MGGWRRYLELQAQAKTGLSSGLFVWALLAVVFGVLTVGFVLLIAFIWLAERYSPLTAAIVLAGLYLVRDDYRGDFVSLVAPPND
jgi:predicted metal-binding membrane protein